MLRHFVVRQAVRFVITTTLVLAGAPRAHAQSTGTVRGVVRDAATQSPIAAAQVGVVGTRMATLSDQTGRYTLTNVPLGRHVLRVRMLGFGSETGSVEVVSDSAVTLDFALRPSVILLDEVVVTGAGTEVARKQLGNTIGTIDARTIELAPVQNFSEALAAREPGVQILPSSGLAGEGSRIRIRGNASLSQNNEPVVYIDGVRIDNAGGFGPYVGAGGAGTASRLDDINPETIERIEILKGAAAATLYGSEANAGVIQIFTKRGTAGRPRFTFRMDQGFDVSPRGAYKPLAGFARFADTTACIAAGNSSTACRTTIGVADRLSAIYGKPIAPYQVFERDFINEELFGTGYHSSYSATVTGGGEAVVYNVAARFPREDGAFTSTRLDPLAVARDYDRKYFGSANITLFPRDRFQLRAGALFTDTHHETPNNSNNIYGVVSSAINSKPELADCEESRRQGLGGAWGQDPSRPGSCAGAGDPSGSGAFITPREAAYQRTQQDGEHFNGNLTLSYQAAPPVKLELTTGIDVTNANDFELLPFSYNVDNYTTNEILGRKSIGSRNNRQFTIDAKATWLQRFTRFSSNLVVGTQGFITRERGKGGFGRDFPGPGIEVAEAGAQRILQEFFNSVVNIGALAQEQVGFEDWAFGTIGARWDRNSAFGETSPWAFYPKISASIIPTDRPGWRIPYVSTLRLRGAVGRSGLQPGAFDKFTTWQALAAELGPGLETANLGNDSLRPEVSTEWELGAEVGVLNNRLGLDVTRWHRTTRDALVQKQYPATGGFTVSQLSNIGWLESQGWDVKLNVLALNKPDLSISVFANAAYLGQWIRSMGGAAPIKVGGSYPRYRNFLRGPDTLYSAPGVIDEIRYYAPGALLGAQVIQTCDRAPIYRGGANVGTARKCWTPGSTVPYDTNNDGVPDTEAQFLAYLGSPRSPDALNPMFDDEDGDRDLLDHYYGKPMPDWQGAVGTTITFRRNLQVGMLFEYKAGNYTLTNLTDAFRTSHPLIGRNTRAVAEVEATLLDPTSTPDQRQAAALLWAAKYKALSPYDGLNQNESGDFLRWRELSITYTAPAWLAGRVGVDNLVFAVTGRNLRLWTGYQGIDPESNTVARGSGSQLDQNYLDAVDGWGFPLPARWTFSVRFGL